MKFFFILTSFIITSFTSLSQSIINNGYKQADSFFLKADYEKAAPLFQAILQSKEKDSLYAEALLRLGIIKGFQNKSDSGIYFLKYAIELFSAKKNNTKLARTQQNIGDLYCTKKNFEEARSYLKEAIKNSTTQRDSVKIYISLLVTELADKNFETAYSLVKKELNNFSQNIVPYQKFYILQAKGNYFLHKKNYDSALVFLIQASNEYIDDRLKANVFNDIAETYRFKKQYPLSFAYQDSAKILATQNQGINNFLPFYDTYSNLYEEKGEYKKALFYARQSRHLSDSFFDIEKNNALLDAEAKYQNEKTKAEKALVEKDNSIKQRNLIISFIGLGLVALLAIIGLRIARNRKKQNNILTKQKQEIQLLADELNIANNTKARLFSTITHDLRGPLSSLYAQVKLNELKANTGNEVLSKQTTNLLDTLEDLLVWSKSQMDGFIVQKVKINLYQLFEELKAIYDVAAHFKKINIFNNAKENVFVRTDENILKTILRNLISNAINHSQKESNILLEAYLQDDSICIGINNSASKIDFEKLKSNFEADGIKSNTNGLGLVLVKEFAQKINAQIQLSYHKETCGIKIFII